MPRIRPYRSTLGVPTPSPTNPSLGVQTGEALPAPATPTKHTVRIYIDNGVCYEYDVHGAHKAREHSAAIVQGGYRHNDGAGEFEHFPPHRVLKVKITGVIPTLYPDRVSGT